MNLCIPLQDVKSIKKKMLRGQINNNLFSKSEFAALLDDTKDGNIKKQFQRVYAHATDFEFRCQGKHLSKEFRFVPKASKFKSA